ncbi:trinucleotide repeat-containing gene 6C protein-like isoform X3 [Paramormyrops kingsleyae]|uniref:trinucleotide repeat-containing gene 6C protein-like isoform X3 n=1 Tax=Paramormyrops kingsleyae TaxID=1676925 RepID=UPI003B97060E
MEEKKKKKQDEKKKKEATQKKAAEPKHQAPESAKPRCAAAPPTEPAPAPPSVTPGTSSGGDGKRPPPCAPQQQPPPTPASRHPPRELPPRFRQQEHKQLLRRGQPLPAGSPPLGTASQALSTNQHAVSSQYEDSRGGGSPTGSASWDQLIVDDRDAEAWPRVSRADGHALSKQAADADSTAEGGSSMSGGAEGSPQACYPGNHPVTSTAGLEVAGKAWDIGPAHCPAAIGGDGNHETPPTGGRGQPSWSSSAMNLNPSANPSAWPVLGQDGAGGSLSGNAPPPGLCGPVGGSMAHMGGANTQLGGASCNAAGNGGVGSWGGTMTPDGLEKPPSPSVNMPTGGKPQNCNANGPIRSSWGSSNPVRTAPDWEGGTTGSTPANQESGSSWDLGTTAWGRGSDRGAATPGWDQSSSKAKGPESAGSPQQEHTGSWGCGAGTPSSEGSSDSHEGPPRHRKKPSTKEVDPPVPAQDLDPRVLCNTGWGQTPVRQHTVWETEEGGAEGSDPKPPTGRAAEAEQRSEIAGPGVSTATGWGGPDPHPRPSRVEPHTDRKVHAGPSGWAGSSAGAGEEMTGSWHSYQGKAKPVQGWSDGPQATPPHGWAGRGGALGGESKEGKSGPAKPAWEGEGDGWKESSLGWGAGSQEVGGAWGEQLPSPEQTWGGKSQEGGGRAGGRGGPTSVKPGSWIGGSGGSRALAQREAAAGQPTGWEEPRSPSIRHKMEIDDGTSAWGNPNIYSKAINLWDKNKPPGNQEQSSAPTGNGSQSHHSVSRHSQLPAPCHGRPAPVSGPANPSRPQQPGAPGRPPMAAAAWPEQPTVPPKTESTWGQPTCPSVSVDNGTSAWGKPPAGCGGWGSEGPEGAGPFSRGGVPPGPASRKPAPKPMQEGWGGRSTEEPTSAGGPWEAKDVDVWSGTAAKQESSSWGNLPRKVPQKGKAANKQDDSWIMSHLIKQLTDMGFPRDPAEEALKSTGMNLDQAMSVLLEKKTALDKRGLVGGSDYSNGPVPKPGRTALLPKDPPPDRPAFGDNGGVFGSSGAALARSAHSQHQAPPPLSLATPLSSSQTGHRAQVPQLLSPQVQAQLLQLAAKSVGLNPGLLGSPANPQHTNLLNQLYQLQLTYQRLQIQQQMLQTHRTASGPARQQEQQVARTISSMQQQIQQQQRQLAQALLKKQQAPTPSHPGAPKSALDGFAGHHPAPGLADMQTKEPQSAPSSYAPYSLAGLNLNMNVTGMEADSLCVKDPSQPQSRLSQWTHPSPREGVSDPGFSKYGSMSKLGPPQGKPTMDSSFSYNLHPSAESPTSSLVTSEGWAQVKGTGDKISNGTSVNWPPEFCPGVPWKGLQSVDPETDPDATPGSVAMAPTVNTSIHDVNRYLLRDASAGKMSDKPSWSTVPPKASLSHELWKGLQVPRNTTAPPRPPPGLANAKPSSAWGGSGLGLPVGWSTTSYSAGSSWGSDSSSRTSSWLVLRNLTPQIDGSTLRTLCLQHGPLLTFHLSLSQGSAVVRYSSSEEAAKAQKSLHMCVLGNTTILAEFAGEEEVNRFFAQGRSLTPPASNQGRLGLAGAGPSHSTGQWSDGRVEASDSGSGGSGTDLLWGGAPSQYSSLWGSPRREDGGLIGSPAPISTLLPGDLLSGESL